MTTYAYDHRNHYNDCGADIPSAQSLDEFILHIHVQQFVDSYGMDRKDDFRVLALQPFFEPVVEKKHFDTLEAAEAFARILAAKWQQQNCVRRGTLSRVFEQIG